jgi:glycosyltransferase involved in cell wall biosynthesis
VQIWSFTPEISYALGSFGEEKVVYYCVDDHASFSGYDSAQVLKDEEELCRRSDLVITTSMALQNAKSSWNHNTVLVPHGVDFDHFSRAVHEDFPCPEDVASIPRPRLGFFGLIRDWVNVDLLAEVAGRRRDWHFVLIGDADSSVDLGTYRRLPNMHFLGRKNYDDLPSYCRHFDVGLIPFRVNELTHAVNPIKLREYLAAGLPVVSTPMPEVEHYRKLVEIAESSGDFEGAVVRCLEEDEERRRDRSRAMAEETWSRKMDAIGRRLEPVQPHSTC